MYKNPIRIPIITQSQLGISIPMNSQNFISLPEPKRRRQNRNRSPSRKKSQPKKRRL